MPYCPQHPAARRHMKEETIMLSSKRITAALVAARLLFLFLVWQAVFAVVLLLRHHSVMDGDSVLASVLSIINLVCLLIIVALVMLLMHNIRAGRTPFALRNVRQLKGFSLVMLVFALVQVVVSALIPGAMQIFGMSTQEGNHISYISHGVFPVAPYLMLAFALLLYCLSLAFAYGMSLQQQSDETL